MDGRQDAAEPRQPDHLKQNTSYKNGRHPRHRRGCCFFNYRFNDNTCIGVYNTCITDAATYGCVPHVHKKCNQEYKCNLKSNKHTKENTNMQKMTSAYANKMLKSLEEDKAFWVNKESTSSTYVAAVGEEPVIPDYDYRTVAETIREIDEKIAVIKHALNLSNATAKVPVGDKVMSVDTILIKMAQLNRRKATLDDMRKQLPKVREEQHSYISRNSVPEYRYINYDLELVKEEYEKVTLAIMEMQMALDKYNQIEQFDVDI